MAKGRGIVGGGVREFMKLSEESLRSWYEFMVAFSDGDSIADSVEADSGGNDREDEDEVEGTPKEKKKGKKRKLLKRLSVKRLLKRFLLRKFALFGLLPILVIAFLKYRKIGGKLRLLFGGGDDTVTVPAEYTVVGAGTQTTVVGEAVYKKVDVGGLLFEDLTGRTAAQGRRVVTSDYGVKESIRGGVAHSGVDVGQLAVGTELRALDSGVITKIWGTDTDLGGYSLQMRTDDGYTIGYAHLQTNDIRRVGDRVEKGDVIARSGDSGRTRMGGKYAPHLHLKVKSPDGSVIDPMVWYAGRNSGRLTPYVVGGKATTIQAGVQPSGAVILPVLSKGNPMEVSEGVEMVEGSIAERANNPMSLTTGVRAGSADKAWDGQIGYYPNGSHTFAVFGSTDAGIRAGMLNFQKYQTKRKVSGSDKYVTIGDVSKVYTSTQQQEWATNVSKISGYGVDERIDLTSPDVMRRITPAIMRQESGTRITEAAMGRIVDEVFGGGNVGGNDSLPYIFGGNSSL